MINKIVKIRYHDIEVGITHSIVGNSAIVCGRRIIHTTQILASDRMVGA